MSEKALKILMKLSPVNRRKVLSDVWCSECRRSVAISDYSIHPEEEDIVLRGFCAVCGKKVARVVEGGAGSVSNIRKKIRRNGPDGLYVFDVWLWGDPNCALKNRIIRKIQIPGTKSLYHFAEVITRAFDFDLDHCFSFYERREGHHFAGRAYEFFVDIGEEPTIDGAKGVKRVKVRQAFSAREERMIFFFDYGDSWQFEVVLKEIKPSDARRPRSVILEKTGDFLQEDDGIGDE